MVCVPLKAVRSRNLVWERQSRFSDRKAVLVSRTLSTIDMKDFARYKVG